MAERGSLIVFIIAAVATAMFAAGIFSPGWTISGNKYRETFEGIFFKTKCNKNNGVETCESKTYLEEYNDAKSNSYGSSWATGR